jgi:spermidine synthase
MFDRNRTFLYFTVFVSGVTTLAIELTASRLLGSIFGTSNLVWASIIGLILIYLAAGYSLGGRWADRSPSYKTMYTILAWGAFTSGLVPLAARPVLRFAAGAFDQLQVGILFGSFTAVLILFSVPVTLLGMISPFAIRLAIQDPRHAGEISGRIYAVSTLGSFLGTFLPGLVLIPLIGTALTFIAFSGFLLLVALAGLWRSSGWRSMLRWAWMPVLLGLLALLFSSGPIKTTQGQIYETESAYNYIQVLESGEFRMLRLNEGQGIHSIWHPTQLGFNGTWEQFLAAPFFNPPPHHPEQVKNMAIVGLAAGTTARQATAVYGAIPIDGFEIDPEIIEVGRKYFDMNEPNLNAIAQDGRLGLQQSKSRYSIIGVDAYRPPYIPWHLTTREFFQLVYDRLTPDGAVVINVGRAPDDRRLVDGLASTMQAVFPSVYIMDVPNSFNSILYATRQASDITNLYQNLLSLYARDDVDPLLIRALENVVVYEQPVKPCGGPGGEPASGERTQGCVVFTDDLAPVEWITNDMVLRFVLYGEVEELH